MTYTFTFSLPSYRVKYRDILTVNLNIFTIHMYNSLIIAAAYKRFYFFFLLAFTIINSINKTSHKPKNAAIIKVIFITFLLLDFSNFTYSFHPSSLSFQSPLNDNKAFPPLYKSQIHLQLQYLYHPWENHQDI